MENKPHNWSFQDHTDQRFGKLVAIRWLGYIEGRKHAYWECRCDCGNITRVYAENLSGGKTKSCGCQQEQNRNRRTTRILVVGGRSMCLYDWAKEWKLKGETVSDLMKHGFSPEEIAGFLASRS